ncbi:MAG: hypothetical protein OXN89_02570 [Bryobacterales bacterium]|nr:hypothetical protein [Bryobacterales bacterium]
MIRFKFDMPEAAYNHWLLGRQGRPVNDVVREAIGQTCKNPKAIRQQCEHFADHGMSGVGFDASTQRTRIIIQMPAQEWEAAVRRIGRIGKEEEPVQSRHLLVALILESPSWKQEGDPKGEFDSGWKMTALETSVQSLTISSGQVSLAHQELRLVKFIAYATVVAAGAAVASAIAAWWGLQSREHTVGPEAATMESVVMESPLMSNEDTYEDHSERLNELRTRGREYADALRAVARVLAEGEGRPEDDQLLMSVPSCDALLYVHTQIRAARGQLRRAGP